MRRVLSLGLVLLYCTSAVLCDKMEKEKQPAIEGIRKPKLFSVLQVVQFQNTGCASGTNNRNGTCYTPAECTAKGGTSSGTCASGYGVCCIFTLGCGGTSSQNCTYLVQTSTTATTANSPCTYTICKCSSNICRIRLDFTAFSIAGPVPGTTVDAAVAASTSNGAAIGNCVTDTFAVTSPGSTGSPVICGINTGQHMYIDASSMCNVASFDLGATAAARNWDIKVTQYACGDQQGGPPGCLQYFTGTSGTVSSYNFPTTTPIGSSITHLANQNYVMCFRQEAGMCSICYIPSINNAAGVTPTMQNSFGLSVDGMTAGALTNTKCSTDYLVIPSGNVNLAAPVLGSNPERFCGRALSAITGAAISISVCSAIKPFQIQFVSDSGEATVGTMSALTNEQSMATGGIVGFSLNYVEQPCPAAPAG